MTTLVGLLPPERRDAYLVRLAQNEAGLSHKLAQELRALNPNNTNARTPAGERVPYAILLAESESIQAQWEQEKREQERLAHQRHLQDIFTRQDDTWKRIEQAVMRQSGAGYDEAAKLLVELRSAAEQFKASQQFQTRFAAWVQPHLRRPALVKRLQDRKFTLPQG